MNKTMGLLFLALLAHAECLVVDKMYVQPGPGNTFTVGTGEDLKAKLTPSYVVVGHNSCKDKSTGGLPGFTLIRVGFYDKEGYRTGVDVLNVAVLKPGEKFRAIREIPEFARQLRPVWKVAVVDITE